MLVFLAHSTYELIAHHTARAVAAHVTSSPFFARSRTLSCYLSKPSGELDTDTLILSILQSGERLVPDVPLQRMFEHAQDKALFVPRIESIDGQMDFVRLYDDNDLSSLPSGMWGIKEPGRDWQGQGRSSGTCGRTMNRNFTGIITDMHLNEVMDASCEPLDLILLPGKHSLVCHGGMTRSIHAARLCQASLLTSACLASDTAKGSTIGSFKNTSLAAVNAHC